MEVFKGTVKAVKFKCVGYKSGSALYSEMGTEDIEWSVKVEKEKAIISFGWPIEYYIKTFAKELDLDDRRPFCLNGGSGIGETAIYLTNGEYRRLIKILKENDGWIAVCEGLSTQTPNEQMEEEYKRLSVGGEQGAI